MSAETTLRAIDFHSHFYQPAWFTSQGGGPVGHAWPLLTNIHAQLEAMEQAGIDAKVLSAPPATLMATSSSPISPESVQHINDHFASLIASAPQQLLALATIDAFAGESAAHEVERAINDLGMRGICVDCASGNRFLDAPEAQPTLQAAADLNALVFVHPVNPPGFTQRLAFLGHTGVLLARGTEDAASILALLKSGVLDRYPTLKLVIPMIGVAALLFAGLADQEYGREQGWKGSRPSELRKRLYIDTMCFDPVSIRFAVDLLGADHVLLGSDWPIMPIMQRTRIDETLRTVGLTPEQQRLILSENTLRLLAK